VNTNPLTLDVEILGFVIMKRPWRYGIDDRLRLTPNMDGIIVDETLTLLGIELAALKYCLGTRSAISGSSTNTRASHPSSMTRTWSISSPRSSRSASRRLP
jgi:hypothetical protein